MKIKVLFSLAVASCLLAASAGIRTHAQHMSADLVIINANIRTLDKARPQAEAVAVHGTRIVALGTTADIRKLAGTHTRVIDAGGALVLPGFNDSHVHFIEGGSHLASVQLRDAASPQEFAARIRQFAARVPKGRWITGGDWDHERWPGAPLPTKELIDEFTPDHPVFVNRLDGHMSLANSVALKLAGVTKETKDPDGGLIVRDPATGEPTGVLKDAAMAFVNAKIPAPSFDEKLEAARAATAHAASLGVTSVQDMSAGDDVGVFQTLAARGELKTRVYAVSPLPRWERLAQTGVRAVFGSDLLRVGGLKGFADGSLGSTTALFFDPYRDAPATRGLPSDEMFPEGEMLKRVTAADAAGLQVMIHAIGDSANDRILSIFEQVARAAPARSRRFRIEHAQHIRAADIARFARGGVIASMQPYHAIDDGRWAEKRIGHERARTTYPFRSLLDAGAHLAFGTDWYVAPLNPMLGIYAAVTRRTLDGKNPEGWIPEQKITVEETVRAYTVGSAYAEFAEHNKGTLAPGKLADMVLLSQDIFRINPVEIERTKVRLTIMDGRVIYEEKR
ncbi:MAG TPA: amidohydrolase [Pyrinomonadaceae bacterium]|nr:amidohydrolase [Pyrinomonadaceae bacterium]